MFRWSKLKKFFMNQKEKKKKESGVTLFYYLEHPLAPLDAKDGLGGVRHFGFHLQIKERAVFQLWNGFI